MLLYAVLWCAVVWCVQPPACCAVPCCAPQVRNVPGDHDLRVADLLELVQLTGLGDR
jgi:hypothetical protein